MFSPAAGWVVCDLQACFFLFPYSLRNPFFEQQDVPLCLGEGILTSLLFFVASSLLVLAVVFPGFGFIKCILLGLVLSCFAACTPPYTPVQDGSQIPTSKHLYPPCSMAWRHLPWSAFAWGTQFFLVCYQGWKLGLNAKT